MHIIRRNKQLESYVRLCREAGQAQLTRRELLQMGLLAAGSLLAAKARTAYGGDDDDVCPAPGIDIVSPPTRPWMEELPRLVEKQTVLDNNPANISIGNGGGAPGPDPVGWFFGGDSKYRLLRYYPALASATPYPNLSHQGWGKSTPLLGNHPPKKWYEMRAKQFNHVWHRDLPAGSTGQPAWGFDGVFPGPMFRTRYGEPHFVRIHNDLPQQNLGFGINQISTHLHNLHTPSESDGNPLYTNYPGHYWDHHYPNVYAGVKQFGGIGNPNEALGTLWYHDHKLDFTAQNVYAGLAGMNSIYDAPGAYADPTMGDYGDETKGWRLPCGPNFEFDVGLVFHDRQFGPDGADFFPLNCFDGAIGDKMTVNGKIQPYMPVKRRRYRFRLLNIGPSRFYRWYLRSGTQFQNFTVIANDGNLLPYAASTLSFRQAVAERFDVIIDFSQYAPGQEIYLVNRAEQVGGRGPTGKLLTPGIEVLKFIVTGDAVVDDSLPCPAGRRLRPLPDINQPVSRTKTWVFDRSGGEWTVNDQPFDRNAPPYQIPEGTAERWTIIGDGGSWSHPVHIHYEEHRFLTYNGVAPDPKGLEAGRKDVIRIDPNAKVEIYMRFRDYKGLYPMHCHNVVHEDHAMMINWKIV